MKDYTSKVVFMGIDVHKKTYSVACICDNEVVKRDTMPASPEGLYNYINKYFPGAKVHTAYEAGFSGFALHRYLVGKKIDNIVVHVASIEVSSRDRVKTDKRDAMKIAKQLSVGRLSGIHVPDEQREQYRAITRLRETFISHRRRISNQLKSFLYFHGLMTADLDDRVNTAWISKVLNIDMPDDLKYCVKIFTEEWQALSQKIKTIEDKLSKQAEADQEVQSFYEAVPGIGKISARVLANELEDTLHFHSIKGLYSFVGLTPSEHSSGEYVRQGHISRQGRPLLRRILIQNAWVAIKKDPRLKKSFDHISKRSGKKRAIVAIARKLIGCVYSCFKNGEFYMCNYHGN